MYISSMKSIRLTILETAGCQTFNFQQRRHPFPPLFFVVLGYFSYITPRGYCSRWTSRPEIYQVTAMFVLVHVIVLFSQSTWGMNLSTQCIFFTRSKLVQVFFRAQMSKLVSKIAWAHYKYQSGRHCSAKNGANCILYSLSLEYARGFLEANFVSYEVTWRGR